MIYGDGGVDHKMYIKQEMAFFSKDGEDMRSTDFDWEKYLV